MHEMALSHQSGIFAPPFTTIHVGMIEGGIAANIVAPSCRFLTDIRAIEGVDPRDIEAGYRRFVEEDIVPSLKQIHPEADVTVERRSFTPALNFDPAGEAEQLARRITGDTSRHTVAYGSEAGIFQRTGLSTIVCGPGSIDQAHKPDEYIEAEQLSHASRALDALIEELAR